jgi:hypothetical protein
MSMFGPSVEELARITDPVERQRTGMIRRFAIKVTSRVLWQLLGYKIDALVETLQAEPFTGIGFYARPPRDGRPEAIAVNVGGTGSPAIVATRDERTRARMVPNMEEGEAAMYGDRTIVWARQNTIEARLADGTAVPLATLEDVRALWEWLSNLVLPVQTQGSPAVHSGFAGPPPPVPVIFPPAPTAPVGQTSPPPPEPTGTTVLRGQ